MLPTLPILSGREHIMANIIACNVGSYGRYRDRAYDHLRSIGLTNVEVGVPPADAVPSLLEELGRCGLKVTTVMGSCDLADPECAAKLAPQASAARALGARVLFLSVKAGDLPKETAYARLRAAGDVVAPEDVTIACETHPDLIHNGDVALETMRGVDHPNVRVNFDTGNVYYYNQGTTSVAELRKIAPYVASVHLKDTGGGFHAHDFPTLGQGVVDYPEVFRILNGVGMFGPFTMELEGIAGEDLTEQQQLDRVAQSLDYLKSIGAGG